MKLIIQNGRIVATATDDYEGPDAFLPEPEDFDILHLTDYRVVDGSIVLPPEPVQAPEVVTMRQARLALLAAGKLDSVDTAINGLPSPQMEVARIEWDYATEVRRDWPLVLMLAPALGLDAAGLDALFVAAAGL